MNARELMRYQADRIEQILAAKGLTIQVTGGTMGYRLVVFRAVKPAAVNLSAIIRQTEEIALGLGVKTCRVGRSGGYLTIEIPRTDPETVNLIQLMEQVPGRQPGTAVVGVDEENTPLLLSLESPNTGHVLIAGTTGSGKTALARAMIASLSMRNAVYELGLLLIDPKRRGYVPFNGLPHLVHPVIHSREEALGVLAWLVTEMERRDRASQSAPRLVVFIDELADLMLVTGENAEVSLTRLLQRGREAGIHIVACTQKPTTSVIGSLIKANFPTRIVGRVTDTNDAYVASGISGTGAERLLGKGDFLVVASGDVMRMQGAYISETEITDLVTRLRGGQPFNGTLPLDWAQDKRQAQDRPVNGKADLSASGRILNFVERYREHHSDPAKDSRGGHNRKPATEAMIEFALAELRENGEVSQRAVQRFHKEKYGTWCNARRAIEAIEEAQRRNSETAKGDDPTQVEI